jgi:hypothetical protein
VKIPSLREVAEWWDWYWFTPAPTVNLALARVLAVAAQLFWLFPSLDEQLVRLESSPHFIHPQFLIRVVAAVFPREVWFTPHTITVVWWSIKALGLLSLVGLFTRVAMPLFALGSWLLVAHRFSYGDVHHSEAMFALFLLSLSLSPCSEDLSLDAWRARRAGRQPADRSPLARWPFALAHLLLATTYLSTGLTKMVFGGLQWMNGYTLQRPSRCCSRSARSSSSWGSWRPSSCPGGEPRSSPRRWPFTWGCIWWGAMDSSAI